MRWSEKTRSILAALADDETSGVRLVHGLEAGRKRVSPPRWATQLDSFRPGLPADLPDGYTCGWWYTAPVIDMPTYLAYLVTRLRRTGGVVEPGRVGRLADAARLAPVVVNCVGIWARELVPDPAVTPTRGQLLVVENPGIDWFFIEHDESPTPTYLLPHGAHLVLGGSAEPGRTSLSPEPATTAAIRQRCAAVERSLAHARVLSERVGLRAYRPEVRVEPDEQMGQVIHNYGHGGAGVTLSWGCAGEVLRLVTVAQGTGRRPTVPSPRPSPRPRPTPHRPTPTHPDR